MMQIITNKMYNYASMNSGTKRNNNYNDDNDNVELPQI